MSSIFTGSIFRSTVHLSITDNEDFINNFLEPIRNSKRLNKCVCDALKYAYDNYSDFIRHSEVEVDTLNDWKEVTDINRKYRYLCETLKDIKTKSEHVITTGDNSDIYRLLGYIATLKLDGVALPDEEIPKVVETEPASSNDNLSEKVDALATQVQQISEIVNNIVSQGIKRGSLQEETSKQDIEPKSNVSDVTINSEPVKEPTIQVVVGDSDKETEPVTTEPEQNIDLVPLKQETNKVVDVSDEFESNVDDSDLLDTIKSFGLM